MSLKDLLKRIFHRRHSGEDDYRCSRCGHAFSKEDAKAKASGWPTHPYGMHIHCPKCGAVVDQYVKN